MSITVRFARANTAAVSVDPVTRGAAILLGLTGTLLCRSTLWLALAWCVLCVSMFSSVKVRVAHFRFAVFIWLPLLIALVTVWGVVVGATPGLPLHTAPLAGAQFGLHTALRILVLAAIVQVGVLSLAGDELVRFAQSLMGWEEAKVALLGAVALVPEIALRLNQIVAARTARGLVPDNRWRHRVRLLPVLLPPLFAWVLRSALQRGEIWENRDLVSRLRGGSRPARTLSPRAMVPFIAGLGWLVLNTLFR